LLKHATPFWVGQEEGDENAGLQAQKVTTMFHTHRKKHMGDPLMVHEESTQSNIEQMR